MKSGKPLRSINQLHPNSGRIHPTTKTLPLDFTDEAPSSTRPSRDYPTEYIERLITTESLSNMNANALTIIDEFANASPHQRYERKCFATSWCSHKLSVNNNWSKTPAKIIELISEDWNNAITINRESPEELPRYGGMRMYHYDSFGRHNNTPVTNQRMQQFYQAIKNGREFKPTSRTVRNNPPPE